MLTQDQIERYRCAPVASAGHFIDGRTVGSDDGAVRNVVSPIDGQPFATIADGGEAEVALATAAARRAFEDRRWSDLPLAKRKEILLRIAEILEQRAIELAVLGVRENGSEIRTAFYAEPLGAAECFRYYAEALDKLFGQVAPTSGDRLGLIQSMPVGVVGAIVPWNFPLMIAAWKVAPALAAGNCVVVKPSETASLLVLRLAEIAAEAGLPDGVLNVVTGDGAVAGKALGLSPEVDVLAFTGSGRVGRQLLEYSARSNLKRVYLELGGKSANIVMDDVEDLDAAARGAANAIFVNCGQVCIAGSRLLVQRSIRDEFLARLKRAVEAMKVGDPLDLDTTVGAVHSPAQLAKVEAAVTGAKASGATCLMGGERRPGVQGGYFYAPTVIADADLDSSLMTEEVFGPVLATTTFEDEEEALRIANSSIYGLAAGLWTGSLSRAHRMSARIEAGAVHVNCYGGADFSMPIGGMKQSGNGYDRGLLAIDKYVNHKSTWIALSR